MNINDLLNSEHKKAELGYDLRDDLVFFMHNDPDFYRQQYFPKMLKFDKHCKRGKKVLPQAFASLVKEAYNVYKNKFPVEGLEKELEEEMCNEICEYILEQETQNSENGFYDATK